MKFPVTIRHRASKANIYGPGKNFACYRLAYVVAGNVVNVKFPSKYPANRPPLVWISVLT